MRKLFVYSFVVLLLAGIGVSCSNEGLESNGAAAAPGGDSTAGPAPGFSAFGGGADGASGEMSDVSYCLGFDIGMNMARQGVSLAPADFIEGFQAGFSGSGGRMSQSEMQQVMNNFQRQMMAKQNEMLEARGAEALREGESFLAENKNKEGVVTTESGLQYKVIARGEGKQPGKGDTVKVNYEGTLLDGTVFDSSYKRGEPVSFPVGRVIPGWTEALLLMKEGCKWELYIPSELAYGLQGTPGGPIGPNEMLIFTVELLEVNAAPDTAAPAADAPANEKPAADAPANEKPAADAPANEKPAADLPPDEKPDDDTADPPAADPPAEEKPADDAADPAPEAAQE